MTDEEKKAIEYFKSNLEMTKEMGKRWGFQEEIKNNETILNLIEKQSKEIEEYKECERLSKRQLEKQKNDLERLELEIEELKEVKWYYEISRVPKDKIKAKIEYYKKIDNPVGERVLQSLLEKE